MNRWFAALLTFEAEVDGVPNDDRLCEASVRLVEAADLEAAQEKARRLGRESEHVYLNENGERVTWRFDKLIDVQEVGEGPLVDGVEVLSRLYRKRQHQDATGSPFVD
jgi:hypothetical protein